MKPPLQGKECAMSLWFVPARLITTQVVLLFHWERWRWILVMCAISRAARFGRFNKSNTTTCMCESVQVTITHTHTHTHTHKTQTHTSIWDTHTTTLHCGALLKRQGDTVHCGKPGGVGNASQLLGEYWSNAGTSSLILLWALLLGQRCFCSRSPSCRPLCRRVQKVTQRCEGKECF